MRRLVGSGVRTCVARRRDGTVWRSAVGDRVDGVVLGGLQHGEGAGGVDRRRPGTGRAQDRDQLLVPADNRLSGPGPVRHGRPWRGAGRGRRQHGDGDARSRGDGGQGEKQGGWFAHAAALPIVWRCAREDPGPAPRNSRRCTPPSTLAAPPSFTRGVGFPAATTHTVTGGGRRAESRLTGASSGTPALHVSRPSLEEYVATRRACHGGVAGGEARLAPTWSPGADRKDPGCTRCSSRPTAGLRRDLGGGPDPHPGPGQIRITVRAASVNPIDWKILSGAMSGGEPLEGTGFLGVDAAGVVDEVGEGVSDVAVGDEVLGTGAGTQAELAVLDAWAGKPPAVDWAVAAAACVSGETAERGLRLLGAGRHHRVRRRRRRRGRGDHGADGRRSWRKGHRLLQRGEPWLPARDRGDSRAVRRRGCRPRAGGCRWPGRCVFDVAGKTPAKELVGLVAEPSQVLSIANFAAVRPGPG